MNTLADSGYLVGLFNPKDHHHARCEAFLATTLKIDRIASTDVRDFSVYRLPGNRRFAHVLDP